VAIDVRHIGKSSLDRRIFQGEVLELGRSASNDLVLSNIAIGRNHLRLRVEARGLHCEWVHPQTPVLRENGQRVCGGELVVWNERLQLDQWEIRFTLPSAECICEDYRRQNRVPYGESAFLVREASGLPSSIEVLEVVCLQCKSKQHVDVDHSASPPTVRWHAAWRDR